MDSKQRIFGLLLIASLCAGTGYAAHVVRYSEGWMWAAGVGSLALNVSLLIIMVAVYIRDEMRGG